MTACGRRSWSDRPGRAIERGQRAEPEHGADELPVATLATAGVGLAVQAETREPRVLAVELFHRGADGELTLDVALGHGAGGACVAGRGHADFLARRVVRRSGLPARRARSR